MPWYTTADARRDAERQTAERKRGMTTQVERGVRPLRRGVDGVCTRSTCECERERLGDQCIWLRPSDAELERRTGEPHIDGYPLQSGLPPPAKTLSQKMREAGYTRRPTWRRLPSDE